MLKYICQSIFLQNVIIENKAIEKEITSSLNQVTMLTDYLFLNARDKEARQYSYIYIYI